MGHRRKAREYALQGLYIYEISDKDINNVKSLSWVEGEIAEDIKKFAISLIVGTIEKINELDKIIESSSKNWSIERLNAVDKAILRISIYALLNIKDVPSAVTINEAIELGKIYGGENSGQFINGILDTVRINYLKEENK
jgi:N utilization substance protein B